MEKSPSFFDEGESLLESAQGGVENQGTEPTVEQNKQNSAQSHPNLGAVDCPYDVDCNASPPGSATDHANTGSLLEALNYFPEETFQKMLEDFEGLSPEEITKLGEEVVEAYLTQNSGDGTEANDAAGVPKPQPDEQPQSCLDVLCVPERAEDHGAESTQADIGPPLTSLLTNVSCPGNDPTANDDSVDVDQFQSEEEADPSWTTWNQLFPEGASNEIRELSLEQLQRLEEEGHIVLRITDIGDETENPDASAAPEPQPQNVPLQPPPPEIILDQPSTNQVQVCFAGPSSTVAAVSTLEAVDEEWTDLSESDSETPSTSCETHIQPSQVWGSAINGINGEEPEAGSNQGTVSAVESSASNPISPVKNRKRKKAPTCEKPEPATSHQKLAKYSTFSNTYRHFDNI